MNTTPGVCINYELASCDARHCPVFVQYALTIVCAPVDTCQDGILIALTSFPEGDPAVNNI
jgi:hypothetical protein